MNDYGKLPVTKSPIQTAVTLTPSELDQHAVIHKPLDNTHTHTNTHNRDTHSLTETMTDMTHIQNHTIQKKH